MNTKAAILLVALMALLASSPAISSDEKQMIIKNTSPLTATESVVVDIGNRKLAMMLLPGPQPNCVTLGDVCGVFRFCCPELFCYTGFSIFGGKCIYEKALASIV